MKFMKWSDNFVTGIAIVDHQHRGLVDLINAAAQAMQNAHQNNESNIERLLDGLVDYARTHFRTEDELMTAQGIDKRHLQQHRSAHADFTAQVALMRKRYQDQADVSGEALLRFLSNWLAFHILDEDQRMARELKAIGEGIDPARAYDQVEGDKADILLNSNDVLVRSLVDLFTMMTEQNRQLAQANSRLENYRAELESQVAERTAELSQANRELTVARDNAENASKAKTRFLNTVSHELLTPLNAVMGFGHLLKTGAINDKQKQQAEKILQAGNHLLALVNEMLQFSELEANQVKIQRKKFSPVTLIDAVAETVQSRITGKGLKLIIEIDPMLPAHLVGDELHLRQALQILASNAVKFTETGHVTLAAQLRGSGPEGQILAVFEVRDSGIGIAENDRRRLFQPFEQLDASNTRRYSGMGLGLVICQRLIELMQGSLTLDSEVGVGSTFSISLHFAQDAGELSETLEVPSFFEELAQLEKLLSQNNVGVEKLVSTLLPYLQTVDSVAAGQLAEQIAYCDFKEALITLRQRFALAYVGSF